MSNEFLPFAKPCISEATIDEVIACLESGWLATGPRVQKFEEILKNYLHAPHVMALVSATAGLHITLLGLNLKPNDEVITTPMTFVATLNAIVLAGAKPVLVDVEALTYNIDLNRIEAAITPRTRAIIPVHFAGLPVDLDPLYDIADHHGLRVIEDAAHAIGTRYKNRMIGSFGDTQIFSFHPNKVMTSGEGGCVSTRDEELAQKISRLRFHGMDRNTFNRFAKSGSQHYDVVEPGFKYNMMDIQAAIGLHQLAELDGFLEKRKQLVERYQHLLKEWTEFTLPTSPSYSHQHAWYIFAPLINPNVCGMTRDEFMQKMKDANIGTGLHYTSAHLFSYYRDNFGFKPGDFPHAENIGERIVSLPLFPHMTFAEQDRVVETMATLFKRKI